MEFLQGYDNEMYEMDMNESPINFADMQMDVAAASSGSAEDSGINPPLRVRKLFPETWLWSNTSTG